MNAASRFSRVAEFVMDQSRKTIRRPERLAIIAFDRLLFRPCRAAIRLLALRRLILSPLDRVLPAKFLRGKRAQLYEALYYEGGNALLDADRPLEAAQAFHRCLAVSKNPHYFFVAAVCLFHGLGRFSEAMVLLTRANELRQKRARELGVTDAGSYRILDDFWSGNFGHTAVVDYVVKLGILEGRGRDDTLFYVAPSDLVANRFLLEQWRSQLRLIERANELPFSEPAVKALRYDVVGPRLPDGKTVHLWEAAAKTYRRWYAEGRGPLLSFPPDVERRAWDELRARGVREGSWFVALHVREIGSKRHHNVFHDVLNAKITSYLPAIAEVTRRGGWVIRMGDPSMVALPSMPNVLDYCHSDLRSDWMDVFIAAHCRFMIGTSSGPAYVPPLYGVPSVLTNWWPPAQRPWHPSDIFIPKMMRRMVDGRLLTLSETLREPFSYCHSLNYLGQVENIRVEDNDPEVIRAAVLEMFDRLEGGAAQASDVEDAQARADAIYERMNAFGMGRLASGFLRRHGAFVA
jgi:putative glycosyltransferase (TIGR04372 family)